MPRFAGWRFALFVSLCPIACNREGSSVADSSVDSRASAAQGAFIVRLGTDTIAAERFRQRGDTVDGVIVNRSPTTTILHYSFSVDSSGNVRHFEAAMRSPRAPADTQPEWQVTIDARSGGFDVVQQDSDSVDRRFVAGPPEAVPVIDRTVSLYELVARRMVSNRGDSLAVPLLFLDPPGIDTRSIARQDADTVIFRLLFPRGERARVDSAGRILGISGLATSYKWLTERVADFDAVALARTFADRDARGSGFGPLSSRDTVRGEIDGAQITIDYGRPSKRGRVIFGGLVPWGVPWRTGADLATHLTTDRGLRVGDLLVPRGTYTLYTLPSPADWKLIVNRKTGQFGVEYDAASDVGRTGMAVSSARDPVERLTISLLPRPSSGGVLRIAWDTLVAEVPVVSPR